MEALFFLLTPPAGFPETKGMLEMAAIAEAFELLQQSIVEGLTRLDPEARPVPTGGPVRAGNGRKQAFHNGRVLEKGGVHYAHLQGTALPEAATRRKPHLAGKAFEAAGVSVVLHPVNPYVPASHLNVRFFRTLPDGVEWWFGGGFDLTPAYGFHEDAVSWHAAAEAACRPFGAGLYPRFKEACDRYFYLPHRKEARGIGGLFFDDFNELGPEDSFALARAVGSAFFPAWSAIARRRMDIPWSARQKQFQLYRRGRYAEFNLLYDRGTRFGLENGGDADSILMSLPPAVSWPASVPAEPDSPESRLVPDFLVAKDWLNESEPGTVTP